MKRYAGFLCALSVIASLLFQPLSAQANTLSFTTARISGSDRIDTAIAASQKGWTTATTVFLDEYNDYPDAIAATPLAVKLNAPVLLTAGKTIDPRVIKELTRLQAKEVILLGGQGCLQPKIEQDLTNLGISWRRIGGEDRYATSILLAKELDSDTAIIANGDNFPDALSAASFAGIKQIPIILTSAQVLPQTLPDYLTERKPAHVIVVGGESVVPTSLLTGKNIQIETRLGGTNRYETDAKIYEYAQIAYSSTDIYLASGEQFPDALVGTVLAAKSGAPLLITTGKDLALPVYNILSTNSTKGGTIYILGGTGVVSGKIQAVIEGKNPTAYLLLGKTIVIDPGHGTPDTGAIGPSGTKEKDNNLAIAQDLAVDLKNVGANVILTRNNDYSPAYTNFNTKNDLQSRVDTANNNHADLFVSIHNDSWSSASGTATYYSKDNPQAAKSLQLAQAIQSSVSKNLGTLNRGVIEDTLYVVHHTTMPAVLVEVAFISNPVEEKELADVAFRQKAADGIQTGILNYYGLSR